MSAPEYLKGIRDHEQDDPHMSTFIGHANDEDYVNHDTEGRRLDAFLDWVDDDGEFMAPDRVSKETYDRKRGEYDAATNKETNA